MAMLGENSWYLRPERHATPGNRQTDRQTTEHCSFEAAPPLLPSLIFPLGHYFFIHFQRNTVIGPCTYVKSISNKDAIKCNGKEYLCLNWLSIDIFTGYETRFMKPPPAWTSCCPG